MNRNCTTCIAYCNMLDIRNNTCGLGFITKESLVQSSGGYRITVSPVNNMCRIIPKPKTKEEFVKTASELGIKWELDDVAELDDFC